MNRLLSIFSCLIGYAAALSLLYHFLNETSEKRYPDKANYYRAGCILGVFLIMLISGRNLGLIRIVVYGLYCLFYSSTLFYKRKGSNIICGGLYAAVSLFGYNLIYHWAKVRVSIHNTSPSRNESSYLITMTASVILVLICYRIIMILYSCFHGNRPTVLETISFLVINGFSLGFLRFILLLHNRCYWYNEYEVFILLMLLGLVVIHIYFLSFASYMTRNNMLRRKLSIAEEKNIMTYEYYRTMEKNCSNCKRVLHDVKNHMQVLEALYHSGTIDQASSYASTMANVIEENYPRSYSDNKMLNIILYDKEKKANDYGITMLYEVENVNISFISDYDLATILCNLFDNAITECKKLEKQKREIRFKLRKVNGFIVLCMENEIPGSIEKEKKLFFRNIESGIGLNNVKQVVHKHNGNCSIDVKDDQFHVSIYFCA